MHRLWPFTPRGTGALALAVAAFIGAIELGLVELVYFGVLLLAVVAAGLASLYLTQRTDSAVRALHPDVVPVGHEADVTVRVGTRSAVPTAPGTWQDGLGTGLSGDAQGVFPALASGLRGAERTVDLSYRVQGERRGVHAIGPLSVRTTDPFGLVRRRTVVGERTRVVVAPEVADLQSLGRVAGEAGGMRHVTNEQLGQGSDNLIPRSYVPGDSMRRIHWRASAHHDTLMVRQEEQESAAEATVVFDRSAPRWGAGAAAEPGADPLFEVAVSACVSAIARLVRDGFGVEPVDSDGAPLASRIDAGDAIEVDRLVAGAATLTARSDDTLARLPRLFAGVLTGPVVVVVGTLRPAEADLLAPIVHHTSAPVLLVADPVGDALERAAEAGWLVARLDADQGAASAWAAALEGAGHAVR